MDITGDIIASLSQQGMSCIFVKSPLSWMNQKAPISVPQVCADLLILISSAGDLRATKGLKET